MQCQSRTHNPTAPAYPLQYAMASYGTQQQPTALYFTLLHFSAVYYTLNSSLWHSEAPYVTVLPLRVLKSTLRHPAATYSNLLPPTELYCTLQCPTALIFDSLCSQLHLSAIYRTILLINDF